MANNQLTLNYRDISTLLGNLYKTLFERNIKPRSFYGVPRGGALIGYLMAAKFGMFPLENLSDANTKKLFPILIIDDILDSGKTLSKFHLEGETYKAVLVTKQEGVTINVIAARYVDKNTWVHFPWEIRADGSAEGIEDNIVRILEYIGEDPTREGLLETPKRVVKAYDELFAGYKQDPKTILAKEFSTTYDQMVVLKGIEFASFCEHHILPFVGTVSVAYIPHSKVVGISKLARLVDCFARRLQIQEQMTEQIANAIEEHLKPLGVAVTITASHYCMIARGVKKQHSQMTTTSLRGAFKDNPETRAEFFSRI